MEALGASLINRLCSQAHSLYVNRKMLKPNTEIGKGGEYQIRARGAQAQKDVTTMHN